MNINTLTSLAFGAATLLASAVSFAAPPAQPAGPMKGVSAPMKPATPAAPTAVKAPRTIVLVHGAFADGSSWDKVSPLLTAKGYNVIAVHESLASLAADVASTSRALEGVPGDAILVGHSYGGVVITEAGNNPKVVGLVYVAAFAPDAGESINDLGKGKPPPPYVGSLKVDSGGFAWLPPETVAQHFAQDVSAADAKLIASKQGPIFTKSFDDKVKTPAWKTKPSWYVQASEDHMIAPVAQAAMAKRINAKTTVVAASHVVMFSKPNDVAAVILAAAAAEPAPKAASGSAVAAPKP